MTNFNSTLGLQAADDGKSVTLDTRPEHEVSSNVIHFAVLATMAEVSAAQAIGDPVVPASVSLSLLKAARQGRLVARGRVLRRGRKMTVAEGEVFQVDTLIAKAVVNFAMA